MENLPKSLIGILCLFSALLILSSCKLPKPGDARKMEVEGQKRARQNVEEGRGWSLKNVGKGRSTTYEFSTSNPLWRATFDVIDFMPLVTVDYSGGMIITDDEELANRIRRIQSLGYAGVSAGNNKITKKIRTRILWRRI